MKNIKECILEKLILNKNTKIKDKLNVGQLDIADSDKMYRKILNFMRENYPTKSYAHARKMEEYMKKGSDPKRLTASIKDSKKLLNRWFQAVKLEWDDAIIEFGDTINNRNIFSLEDLHKFIFKCWHDAAAPKAKEEYTHYLDLYKIIY